LGTAIHAKQVTINITAPFLYRGSEALHVRLNYQGLLRQEVSMASYICFNLCTMHFEFLISTLTPQGNDIMNFERTCFDKDEIGYLTVNQRKLRKTLTKHTRKMIT
jgi:hypothetical protein